MFRRSATTALALALAFSPLTQAQTCSAGIVYDDGTAEGLAGGQYAGPGLNAGLVSRFKPPTYPYRFTRVCLFIQGYNLPPGAPFELVVLDDDGPGGEPGTLLSNVPVTASIPNSLGWRSFDLQCAEQITSGRVWIGFRYDQSALGGPIIVGLDLSGNHLMRQLFGGAWTNVTTQPQTLMVRAEGQPGSVGAATAAFRNGSGSNPSCYDSAGPVLNGSWSATVDASGYAGTPLFSRVALYGAGSSGIFTGPGELLLDLSSPRFLVSTVFSSAGSHLHTQTIPNNPALAGLVATSQAFLFGSSGARLCNAYDLVVGCP